MSPLLTFHTHAKINLYLDVLDRRDDGFNNIETIFQTVSLSDRLTFAPADALTLDCDHAALAAEPDNLVLKAGRALLAHAGISRGAKITLQKRIPIAAGLAGGSGDAAAALTGLNALWSLGYDDATLAQIAATLGSDIPYCLRGGTALATGRGEVITPLPELPRTWLVLVHPLIGVSAAWVYRHPKLGRSTETRVDGQTPQFTRALAALAAGNLAEVIFNRMEGVVFAEHPQLATWKERLLALGCTAAAMSGSGSTLFGLCSGEAEARAIAADFREAPVTVVRTVGQGITPGN